MVSNEGAILANGEQRETYPSSIYKIGSTGSSAARKKTFPQVLHEMLDEVEERDQTSIVSWQPHGRSFRVHNPKRFVNEIMQLMFRQTKWPSFQRQLNLYGFTRISAGKDKGAYYHRLFLRGRAKLCEKINIIRDKGNRFRVKANPELEPDFYAEPYITKEGTVKDTRSGDPTPNKRFRRRFNVVEPKTPISPTLSLTSDIDHLEKDCSPMRSVANTDVELPCLYTVTPPDSQSEDESHFDDHFYTSFESRRLLVEDIGNLSDDEQEELQEYPRPLLKVEPAIPSTLPDDPIQLLQLFHMMGKPFRLDDLDLLPDNDIGWKHLLHSP